MNLFLKFLIWLLSACTIESFGEPLFFNSDRRLKCISLNNRQCQTRPAIVDMNSNETLFYSFTVSVNKSGRSCNTINDPYAPVCVSNKVKNINAKVFKLMSVVNETKFLVHHESCEYKWKLNESVCNSKRKWNHDQCRCECKELDDWDSCKDDYMWNSSTCNYECNKVYKIDKYLDIKNCSSKKTSNW